MTRLKSVNLSSFLSDYELTRNVAEQFKSLLNFNIDPNMPQRKIIDLGKIISRVISVNQLSEIGTKGFGSDLINSSTEIIRHEVSTLVTSYKMQTKVVPIVEYQEKGNWLDYT
jgi:acyl-CoA dehydrogenase